ncbi:unnamed protein product [Clonostachys byssicola]|uniref:Xylanolytic transcriptional activator regulatory domain-containing protein n=1 Tax=Clonostachys byssicola TaxID=160290 RepID=A0A9N9XZQ6_9HYPO|nr:unnamed protein product [Clonostachys byssicola]
MHRLREELRSKMSRDVLLRHTRAHVVNDAGSDRDATLTLPAEEQHLTPSVEEIQNPEVLSCDHGNGVSNQSHFNPQESSICTTSHRRSPTATKTASIGVELGTPDVSPIQTESVTTPETHWSPLINNDAVRELAEQRLERYEYRDETTKLTAPQDSLSIPMPHAPPETIPVQLGDETLHWDSTPLLGSHLDISVGSILDEASFPSDSFQSWCNDFDGRFFAAGSTRNMPSLAGDPGLPELELDVLGQKLDKTQAPWPRRPRRVASLMHTLWHDVASCTDRNLLSQKVQAGRPRCDQHDKIGVIFDSLRPLTARFMGCSCSDTDPLYSADDGGISAGGCTTSSFSQSVQICHTCKVSFKLLALGLEQYRRKFHATIPIVHIPTFREQETPPTLLFIMCLIGLTFVNSEEATALVSRVFPGVLEQVYSEVVTSAFEDIGPEKRIRMFAASGLMLALVILTGSDHQSRSRDLMLINPQAARQHGLFTANYHDVLNNPLAETLTEHDQWVSWSRVESTKRVIMCLLLADAWFSEYYSTNPIVCTEHIKVFLPCDKRLFQASTSREWAQLKEHGCRATSSQFTISSTDLQLPVLPRPADQYSMKVILCSVLLRIHDSYCVLFCGADAAILSSNQYIPWKVFAQEKKAKLNTQLVLQIMQLCESNIEEIASDLLVIWHQLAIMLTTDCYLLEEAAGREGTESARRAIAMVKIWACTPAARRACLHASQAFKIASRRRPLDSGSFQSPHHLFNAALVLGFYLLVAPAEIDGQARCSEKFEMLSDVDWKVIGAEGLVEVEARVAARTQNAAVNFIRFGGPISIDGEPCHGGVWSAQKIFLDFASLLDAMKKWKLGDYSRLLYTLSENLGQLHMAVDDHLQIARQ